MRLPTTNTKHLDKRENNERKSFFSCSTWKIVVLFVSDLIGRMNILGKMGNIWKYTNSKTNNSAKLLANEKKSWNGYCYWLVCTVLSVNVIMILSREISDCSVSDKILQTYSITTVKITITNEIDTESLF